MNESLCPVLLDAESTGVLRSLPHLKSTFTDLKRIVEWRPVKSLQWLEVS